MKRVTYLCDICGKEFLPDEKLMHISMPRKVRVWAKGGKNDVKLCSQESLKVMPTDICFNCGLRLGEMMTVIDEDEADYTGYADQGGICYFPVIRKFESIWWEFCSEQNHFQNQKLNFPKNTPPLQTGFFKAYRRGDDHSAPILSFNRATTILFLDRMSIDNLHKITK